MGLFYSYCKKCNFTITWFVGVEEKGIRCKHCGMQNTLNELCLSMEDPEYWNRQFIINRILKINKIKNKK